jgi:hypothetical protein
VKTVAVIRAQFFWQFGSSQIDRMNLVNDSKQRAECELNGIAAIDSDITIQDLNSMSSARFSSFWM